MENYKKIAEEVVEAVGGKSNIQENSTCMTRLHLTLADKSKVDLDRVKKIDGVMGTVDGEELQIVFGPGKVTKIGEEVSAITGISADERKEVHNEDLEKDILEYLLHWPEPEGLKINRILEKSKGEGVSHKKIAKLLIEKGQ